jgi:uncharacterized ubiquitin-like protein YukD
MKRLLDIMENELNIVKGKSGMYAIEKKAFIEKVWNGLYNNYLDGSITGTIKNPMASVQYDAETICFTRYNYSSYDINIITKRGNNIQVSLNDVKSINMSISENNWIDIHFLSSSDDNDYSSYVSIVIRG